MKNNWNYEEWNERYHTKKVVNLKLYFNENDFKLLENLGSKVEDKIYTAYEFEVFNLEVLAYYVDDDMDDDELKNAKSLEGTGVSQSDYSQLLSKLDQIKKDIKY